MNFRDTIAAIATPPGVGGVGVIRVSGPDAGRIALRLYRRHGLAVPDLQPRRLYHGNIVDPATGAQLDDVLLALFRAPHSYTGEDTAEISCHGGPLVLRSVLEAVLACGARPAERGEFTKRAFLNDRLDLTQAEAVLDLITARTRGGLAAALERLDGKLSGRIEAIREGVLDLLTSIEAAIDFSAEDGIPESPAVDPESLRRLMSDIAALAATYRRGRILREGVSVVIAGRPNVGKSSLLNRLLGQRRAIVTAVPGTTRDFIEESLEIGGFPVRLTDTAGIREPADAIEEAGIDLVWERIEGADAVLLMLDGSAPLQPEDREVASRMGRIPLIPVVNKSDLPRRLEEPELAALLPETAVRAVRISARTGEGIENLTAAIGDLLLNTPAGETDVTIAHAHQRVALVRAGQHLERAAKGLARGLSPELLSLDLREALDSLGEITGRTTPEELLGRIFARFCVGK
jgi:tRNA modification GTPase